MELSAVGKNSKNIIKEFYKEVAEDKKRLVITKCFSSLWIAINKSNAKLFDDVLELEEIILKEAKKEWGLETEIEFNYEKNIIEIQNKRRNLLTVFDKKIIGEVMK